jgi:hypothetical protein
MLGKALVNCTLLAVVMAVLSTIHSVLVKWFGLREAEWVASVGCDQLAALVVAVLSSTRPVV